MVETIGVARSVSEGVQVDFHCVSLRRRDGRRTERARPMPLDNPPFAAGPTAHTGLSQLPAGGAVHGHMISDAGGD